MVVPCTIVHQGRQLRDFLDGTREPTSATRDFSAGLTGTSMLFIGIESVAAYENLDALLASRGWTACSWGRMI